ncbi:UNVERIFIED_CONTAM: hypothetical protein K2H54_005940 [Gekko kuhli]
MSLVIIMPRSLSQNLSDVEKHLSGDIFKSMMAKLEHIPLKPTVVTIPRFRVDSSLDLTSIVGEMGKKSERGGGRTEEMGRKSEIGGGRIESKKKGSSMFSCFTS